MRKISIYIVFLCLLFNSALASKDTLRVYRLGDVVVSGVQKTPQITASSSVIDLKMLSITDVKSFSELQLYMPSTMIRTNSRGESLPFIRGAGERQMGLFLDGALMNIPWDNRLDFNIVPTEIIGRVKIEKNSNSALWGPNILGGVVSISSYERVSDGIGGNVKLQYTDGGGRYIAASNDGKFGNFNYLTAVSYNNADGFLMSKDAPNTLLHQSQNSRLRTNSDFERLNVFIRSEYKPADGTSLGLSYNLTTAEKGVPSEEYLYAKDARFWRYSDINRNVVTFNAEQYLGRNMIFRTTLWGDFFNQQIDAYDSTYSKIVTKQKDKDFTFGNRFALEYEVFEKNWLTAVFNSYYSTHKEKVDNNAEDEFSQFTYSAGVEYKSSYKDINFAAGATYDGAVTPKTGIYKDSEGETFQDFGLFVGSRYYLTDEISTYANISRRTRFPTLREAYSGALGKFIPNPDLGAETGLLLDWGISYTSEIINLNFTAFGSFYDDLIIRIKVPKDHPLYDPNYPNMRMRDNLAEATVYGAELGFNLLPNSNLLLQGNATFMKSEGKEQGKKVDHLEYKPEMQASFVAGYKFSFGLVPQVELEHIGKQYALNAISGKFDVLESYTLLNLRIGYSFDLYGNNFELFARLNNITDEYYLTQIGLPGYGRTFTCGISVRY